MRTTEHATTLDILSRAKLTSAQLQHVRAAQARRTVVLLDTEQLMRWSTQVAGCRTLANTLANPRENTEEDATTTVQVDQLMTLVFHVLSAQEGVIVTYLYGFGDWKGEEPPVGEIAQRLSILQNSVTKDHDRAKAKLRAGMEGTDIRQP